jgi:outer membrane protein assembly factor BamB
VGGSSGEGGAPANDAATGAAVDAPSGGGAGMGGAPPPPPASAPAGKYDWLQFGFSQDKMSNLDFGHFETKINASNVAKLSLLFEVAIPDAPDGAAVGLSAVSTPMGVKDLIFVVGQHGLLTAFDGLTGAAVWKITFTATGYSNSAPAIDPNRQFIYVNAADAMIHKVQVGDGTEIKSGGWPIANGGGKPSGQLAIGTDKGGVSYLYATNNGHGHATIVNLATGSTHIFNLACSNVPDMHSPAGCDTGANPWARSPVFVPDLQRVFIGTGTNDGSGQFTAGKIWRTSWVALPPDGHTTMMNGGGYPADSYTPADWNAVVRGDRDTSVGGLIPLPGGYSMKYPHLGIQPGKDGNVRLLNLENLSGKGAPGNTGGELQQIGLGMGLLRSWGAVWINPENKVAWVFIGGARGLGTLTVELGADGTPTMKPQWTKPNGWTTAPFVAGGILFATNNAGEHTVNGNPHLIQALDPATGNQLWAGMVGEHHWSSPIMMNGILYLADGSSGGCNVANGNPNCTPAGNTGHFRGWGLK